ncbi:DUF6058 family natural product biosynthesis protein [Actinophytocola xanthii]|uniref:Uncharacterized protein n=1 Tax=Actinophytocola xanthii TaxID=1912961 RepID=A0A1Q8CYP8_9PSEU|nr:DUF6058 family natural product biosynthesis protein [Actinophytocola xanthii]OLF19487.1 hypothetical protein BU204_00755 [Actinophytocola xanthii]
MATPPTFTESDIRYVIAEYRTLGELCHGRAESVVEVSRLIEAGRLPRATYVLPSGEARFPPDYFALLDAAGSVEELPAHFRSRCLAAGSAQDVDEAWAGYLSGEFGVCLREVTPEAIVAKGRLLDTIERLLAEPSPEDRGWQAELRGAVDELDGLERPFTDYDRQRWGDTTRDRCITRVRARFPDAFTLQGA